MDDTGEQRGEGPHRGDPRREPDGLDAKTRAVLILVQRVVGLWQDQQEGTEASQRSAHQREAEVDAQHADFLEAVALLVEKDPTAAQRLLLRRALRLRGEMDAVFGDAPAPDDTAAADGGGPDGGGQ